MQGTRSAAVAVLVVKARLAVGNHGARRHRDSGEWPPPRRRSEPARPEEQRGRRPRVQLVAGHLLVRNKMRRFANRPHRRNARQQGVLLSGRHGNNGRLSSPRCVRDSRRGNKRSPPWRRCGVPRRPVVQSRRGPAPAPPHRPAGRAWADSRGRRRWSSGRHRRANHRTGRKRPARGGCEANRNRSRAGEVRPAHHRAGPQGRTSDEFFVQAGVETDKAEIVCQKPPVESVNAVGVAHAAGRSAP